MTTIIMAAPMNSLPHYRGCLIIVLLLCALTGQVRADEPECPPAPTSELAPAAAEAPGTVHWSGCRVTVAANGDTELTGDVAVSIDGKELRCDHLNYLAATQELKMSGTVRLEDAAVRVIPRLTPSRCVRSFCACSGGRAGARLGQSGSATALVSQRL